MREAATCLVVVVATVSSSIADSSTPLLSPDVQAALKKNAAMYSNVLITGKRSRRLLAPVDTVLKTLQTAEREPDFAQELHFDLRFKGPLFRESIRYPSGKAYTQNVLYEVSFDGTKYACGYKRLDDLASSEIDIHDANTAVAYGKHRDEAEMLSTMKFWYLEETGFIGPRTVGRLGQSVESLILNAVDHDEIVAVSRVGGGSAKVLEVIIKQPEPWQSRETFDIERHKEFLGLTGGTDILQMRIERERRQLVGEHRVIRLWLNAEFGYAVEEKWESRGEAGETMFHTRNSDFVQVGRDGIWTPTRCVVESHAYITAPLFISPDPLYESLIQVDTVDRDNIDGDQFRIWYDTPGVTIHDWTSPKATAEEADTYRVPVAIEKLPKAPSQFLRIGWLVILNILFVAGWIGWLYLRSRRK